MEAFDYEKDYKYAKQLINGEIGGIFKGVFYSSNETIPLTLTGFDLSGKDVLSVIGSGDQVIHALSRDVKSIDVFDICPLPKYYLYLRKWFIKYNSVFYHTQFYSVLQDPEKRKERPETSLSHAVDKASTA